MEMLTVNNPWSGEESVTLRVTEYQNNKSLAISLMCYEGPYATITVNLPDRQSACLRKNYAFVDTNNCPWAPEFIEKYDLGLDTGLVGYSGYCEYPLYEFNLDKLKQIEADGGIA